MNLTFITLTQGTVNCRIIEFIVELSENFDLNKNVGVFHTTHTSLSLTP